MSNAGPALVLFGHGSRDPLWHQPMQAVAQAIVAASPGARVCCAYLELSTPNLPTAVRQLLAEGAGSVAILPMFLGAGKHAREDLPRLVDALRLEFPQNVFTLKTAVGEDPRLIGLLSDIGREALMP